jgi:micrococcal nuclease
MAERSRTRDLAWAIVALAIPLVTACQSSRAGSSESPPSSTAGPPATSSSKGGNAVVRRVIDGDTIDVSIGSRHERVRLIGIDTPETKDPRKPVQCYGPQASALTESLLPPSTAIRLERDEEARDDYGRLLAYVYRARDGLFVNLTLARDGAARELSIRPNTAYEAEIAAAVATARAARRGLWGACP